MKSVSGSMSMYKRGWLSFIRKMTRVNAVIYHTVAVVCSFERSWFGWSILLTTTSISTYVSGSIAPSTAVTSGERGSSTSISKRLVVGWFTGRVHLLALVLKDGTADIVVVVHNCTYLVITMTLTLAGCCRGANRCWRFHLIDGNCNRWDEVQVIDVAFFNRIGVPGVV